MGNQPNITIKSVGRENLIKNKSVTNKLKTSNNINFFLDMISFPEEEKIIVSTPQNLIVFETITFKVIETLEIKNLKVLQNLKNKKDFKNKANRIYSFFASKGGSYASVHLFSINFNDYTVFTKEIIHKNMPKHCFLNFFELSTNLIVIAFNKGTIMVFDEPENLFENYDENILERDLKSTEIARSQIYNLYMNDNYNKNKFNLNGEDHYDESRNSLDNNIQIKNNPIEKERQVFKFKNEMSMSDQQESCGFFEVSDTCFIGITSMGALRFYDYIESKKEFIVSNYMQGFWANPHSKNSIVLLGNKLICAYKGITIIDVNKRLITQQIKSDNINGGIIYLKNETILLVSDYVINLNTKNMKRVVLLSQYIITEEKVNERGKKHLDQYDYTSGDLDGFSREKSLTLVSEKSITQTECNLVTNCIEYLNKIITFSSQEINIIQ